MDIKEIYELIEFTNSLDEDTFNKFIYFVGMLDNREKTKEKLEQLKEIRK